MHGAIQLVLQVGVAGGQAFQVIVTVLLAFSGDESHFEADMRKINYMTDTQQQEYERMRSLLNDHHHVLYYVTEGDTPEAALTANEESLADSMSAAVTKKFSPLGACAAFSAAAVSTTCAVRMVLPTATNVSLPNAAPERTKLGTSRSSHRIVSAGLTMQAAAPPTATKNPAP